MSIFATYLDLIHIVKYNSFIIELIILLIIVGCSKEQPKSYFISPSGNKKKIEYNNINLDSISFQSIESSYVGFAKIVSKSIYFIDQKFRYVFDFDEDGILQARYLGFGRGPNEINASKIEGYENLNGNTHVFIGDDNFCHLYENNFLKKESFLMDYVYKSTMLNRKDIKPENPAIYTLTYRKLITRSYKNNLYFTVYSEHPYFNFITTPKEYFRNCRIIAKMNLSNGKIDGLLGRYSPKYLRDDACKQISLTNFDISEKGDFYVAQEADSLIYVYNSNFDIIKSFGFNGENICWPKHKLQSVNDFKKFANTDRKKYGYFTWIEYIDEKGMLFRSYKRGKNSVNDGLQIYEDGILIGDVDVPKNFKVIGYIPPYYYSNIFIDEENEKMSIYKFKLE